MRGARDYDASGLLIDECEQHREKEDVEQRDERESSVKAVECGEQERRENDRDDAAVAREDLLDPRYHEASEHDLFRGTLRDPHKKREYERQRAFGGDADAVDRDLARDEQQRENKRHHDNAECDATDVELAEVLVCQTDAGGALGTESVRDDYENICDRHGR